MRPKRVVTALAAGLVWVSLGDRTEAASGEWPTYRGNPARTGRSEGTGRIKRPVVWWRFPATPIRSIVELTAGQGASSVALGEEAPVDTDYWHRAGPDWGQDRRRVDLRGDGKTTVVSERTNVRYGRFLLGAKGLQKLHFEDGMSVKNRPDGPKRPVAHAALYRYDRGGEQRVWQSEPEEQAEIPLCALGDMNGDGRLDLAVSTWWRVMVYDLATGVKTMACRWHNGRNYGHFQLANLDDDPWPECLVLADFMIHLNVLDNDGKGLSLAWRKEVEFTLFGKRKTLRVPYEPVVRCGGSRKAIAVNLFNDGGDERWHVTVLEPMTGKVKADLPDRYLCGVVDLDGDGCDELLLASANGRAIPRVGPLFVGQLGGADLRTVSVPSEGAWLTYQAPMRPDRATCAAEGRRVVAVTDLDGDRRGEAWIIRRLDATRRAIECVVWSDGQVLPGLRRCVLPGEAEVQVLAVRGRTGEVPAGMLLRVGLQVAGREPGRSAMLRATGLSAALRSRHRSAGTADVPVAARMSPDEPPTLVVHDGANHLLGLHAPARRGGSVSVRFRHPGRGQTADRSRFWGVELADVNDDGRLEVLAAEDTDRGHPALAARSGDGRVVWRRAFDRFAAGPTQWNTSGILTWTCGRFRRPDRTDVVVTLRRSVMHTDESYLLDGRSGDVVWHRDDAHARGWGGQPFAVGDCTGDGLDDLVCQYPDVHFVARGVDGKLVQFATWPHKQLGGWSAYGFPILVKPAGAGGPAVLTGNCRYTVALWSLTGKLVWHTPYLDGSTASPAAGDFDGDGRLEAIGPAYRGGLRCYDLSSGTVRATLAASGGQVSDVVAADLDGDGRPEAVFSSGSAVRAVSLEKGQLVPRWECPLGSRGYDPIVTDTDGDGTCEVLVLTQAGDLVCIGPDT